MRRFADVAGAVARRSLHNWFTNPAFFLPGVMFPMFFFVAFAGGLSSVGDVPGFDYEPGYTTFQFGFVLVQASAFGGVFTGFAVAADFEFGFARRMLLAAPHRLAVLVGYVLSAMTRALFVVALLFCAGLIVGMNVYAGFAEFVALIALVLTVSALATLFATGFAFRLRTVQAGPAMQMPVFLLLFLAPVYVPLDLVGSWVHSVARVNPMTALLEASRDLLAGADVKAALVVGVLAGLFVLLAVWSVRGLRKAEAAG
jgi:ABC-type multidrug transport system permease subunit